LGRKAQKTKGNTKILGQNPHKPNSKPTRSSKTIGDTPNGIGRKDYHPGSSAARRETPEEMASSMQRGGTDSGTFFFLHKSNKVITLLCRNAFIYLFVLDFTL
jgi:hypothetical protein